MQRQLRLANRSNSDRSSLMLHSKTMVVIDPAVKDRQLLADKLIDGSIVVLLTLGKDGIEQITQAVNRHTNITKLCLIANGSSDCLYIGTTKLNLATLDRYAWDLQTWFAELSSAVHPQLLIYGCNLATTGSGAEFIKRLEQLTGAAIAIMPTSATDPQD